MDTSIDKIEDRIDQVLVSGLIPDDLQIRLTPLAYAKASALACDIEAYRDQALRVYIEGKGCDGFYYGVAFDKKHPNDLSYHSGNLEIIIDPQSFRFMAGSLIDWIDDERGQGFLVENPMHRKFRGKFYKRKSWQERFEQDKKSKSPGVEI